MPEALIRRLHARLPASFSFAPRYNVAPTTDVFGVTNEPARPVRAMRWGLRVAGSGRNAAPRSTFNARIETLATSPLYGPLLPDRRCIVFADGYYEWPPGASEPQPVWIARRDGATIAFAGIWDDAPGCEPRPSVAIVTQPPSDELAAIHDRMPAALEDDALEAWLAPQTLEANEARALLAPPPHERYTVRRVDPKVGNVRNDDPSLLAPYEPPCDVRIGLFDADSPAMPR